MTINGSFVAFEELFKDIYATSLVRLDVVIKEVKQSEINRHQAKDPAMERKIRRTVKDTYGRNDASGVSEVTAEIVAVAALERKRVGVEVIARQVVHVVEYNREGERRNK